MKPLIAISIALVLLVPVLSSCTPSKENQRDTDDNNAYQEAWQRLLESESGNESEDPLDVSNLEVEQKFRSFISEGNDNLVRYNRLESVERNLLKTQTDSPEIQLVLERQKHYLQNAFDCFSQALLIHPRSFVAHQGVALAAAKMGKYDLAIEHALIVLEGSESRTLIYRVIFHAYQRKAMLAESKEQKVIYLSKAALYVERYLSIELYPDNHQMTYMLALTHAEIAANLTGPERTEEYRKAAAIIDNHLAKHPEILAEGSEMGNLAKEMQAASATFKNSK